MDIVTLALSKKYTNTRLAELATSGFTPVKVDTLPEIEDADTGSVYLVPAEEQSDENKYLEYLVIDGKWECIGTTAIDLSDYVQHSELNDVITDLNQMTGKANTTSFSTLTPSNFDTYLKPGLNFCSSTRFLIQTSSSGGTVYEALFDGVIHVLKSWASALNGEIVAWWISASPNGNGETDYDYGVKYVKKYSNYIGLVNVSHAMTLVGDKQNASISGTWNFTKLPTTSQTPTSTNQLVNKNYVDNTINAARVEVVEELSDLPGSMMQGFEYEKENTITPINYTFSNVSGYNFTKNANGYYESQNKGVNSSYALCRITFNNDVPLEFDIDYINYGEATYDYGIFGNVDKTLAGNSSADGATGSDLVKLNCQGQSSAEVKKVSYSIPAGSHYIYIKFIKDGSQNTGNDSLQFKIPEQVGTIVMGEAKMATTEYVDENIQTAMEVFRGDEDDYELLSQEQKNNYLVAFVNPLANLSAIELLSLEEILKDEENTTTYIDLTDEELDEELTLIEQGGISNES